MTWCLRCLCLLFVLTHGETTVKKIEAPKFPVKFELSQKDAMMKSIPFKGPFKIMAKISPSGGAMDKSGPNVMLNIPVNIGHKDLELVLKNQK